MNKTRIVELRRDLGWTQERLAEESGVGIRTVQRLEAGQDASLETLSLVAEALRVRVRDLFDQIEDAQLSDRVESLQARTEAQQAARDRVSGGWRWLFIGIGAIVTLLSFFLGQLGPVVVVAYWFGGFLILIALRRLVLEPWLDDRYPLSRNRRRRIRSQGRADRTSAG